MYSVVLMMALSGGTEAVDFGHRGGRCHGCCGGVVYSGCCGGYRGHGCCGGVIYGGCCGGVVYGGGCTGGWGCTGGAVYGPGMMAPGAGGMGGPGSAEPLRVAPKKAQDEARGPAPATIIVALPANARLTIDNTPTTSTSGRRTLITPALEPGNTYVYTLRAEVNGTTQTQDIRVRAGQTSEAQFVFPSAGVASR